MGKFAHRYLIVTGDSFYISEVHKICLHIADNFSGKTVPLCQFKPDFTKLVTPIIPSTVQCEASFMVAPCGSKWDRPLSNLHEEVLQDMYEQISALSGTEDISVMSISWIEQMKPNIKSRECYEDEDDE